MAKVRRKERIGVSLFPFLSILACVMGVLCLLIAAVMTGQMRDAPDAAGLQRRTAYDQLDEEAKRDQKELNDLQALIAEADAVRRRLEDAKMALKRLEREKELLDQNKAKLKDQNVKLLAELHRLESRINQLTGELADLLAELETLRAELAKRTAPPDERQVQIQPSGSGVDLKPVFVECHKTGVIIHEGLVPTRVRFAALRTDPAFLGLLDRIALTKNRTVIFLIRNDALHVGHQARWIARQRYCRNGKLPIVGQGKIDLTLFR